MRLLVSYALVGLVGSLLIGCGAPAEGDPNPPAEKPAIPSVPGAESTVEIEKPADPPKADAETKSDTPSQPPAESGSTLPNPN